MKIINLFLENAKTKKKIEKKIEKTLKMFLPVNLEILESNRKHNCISKEVSSGSYQGKTSHSVQLYEHVR